MYLEPRRIIGLLVVFLNFMVSKTQHLSLVFVGRGRDIVGWDKMFASSIINNNNNNNNYNYNNNKYKDNDKTNI